MTTDYTCPTACVEQNHPGREHNEWLAPGADERVGAIVGTLAEARTRGYIHEPCGTIVIRQWWVETGGACSGCEDVTTEGWSPLYDDITVARLMAQAAEEAVGERLAGVEMLADWWEGKWTDHLAASLDADSELLGCLQVAAGGVRKLCAEELRAALRPKETDRG